MKNRMKPEEVRHLEMLQSIINRMYDSSFKTKMMGIFFMVALLMCYAITGVPFFIMLIIVPLIAFWSLDSYYLMLERKFRGLYNSTSKNLEKAVLFNINISCFKGGSYSFWSSALSRTILILYVPILIIWLIYFNYFFNFIG